MRLGVFKRKDWAAIKRRSQMAIVRECTHCGTKSTNQPKGDACHTCGRGYMK